MHRIDRMEVRSFGECIYCGALGTDVELTDEHIIPLSLGGKAVILDGSCKACAKETTKLENEIAHKVLWEFRAHVKAPTRRKKKRPKELPFTYSIAGGEKQTKTVPVADHPFFVPIPVWGRPGVLMGKQTTTEFEHYEAHVFYSVPVNIKETLALEDGVLAEIPFPEFRIDHDLYARGIARLRTATRWGGLACISFAVW
jgi:HNH endonuclease